MVPLLILLLALVLIVFPIWAIVSILSLQRRNEQLERRAGVTQAELEALREKIHGLPSTARRVSTVTFPASPTAQSAAVPAPPPIIPAPATPAPVAVVSLPPPIIATPPVRPADAGSVPLPPVMQSSAQPASE